MSVPADALQAAEARIAKLEAWAWGKRCSFCLKGEREVQLLMEGATSLICDECTILCLDILVDAALRRRFGKPPAPS